LVVELAARIVVFASRHFTAKFVIRQRPQTNFRTLLVQPLPVESHHFLIVLERLLLLQPELNRLVVRRRRRRPEDAALTIGRRRALGPQLDGLVLHALVVVAHQRLQTRMRFVAGLLEAAQLRGVVNGRPFAAKTRRPLLARPCLALELLSDEVPGIADRPQLRGLAEK
jgi:hypothetical protein